MNSEALDNLVKAKVLKAGPPDQVEFDGLLKLGTDHTAPNSVYLPTRASQKLLLVYNRRVLSTSY
jgi:hypothetical protein